MFRLARSRVAVATGFRRATQSIAAMAAVLLFAATMSTVSLPAAEAVGEATPSPESQQAEGKQKRLREGTKIETTGYFRTTGDLVTFYCDGGKTRYRSLENLNLERISRAIEDNPGQIEWTVSGVVTEYRGANCILINYAAVKTNVSRDGNTLADRAGD